MKRRGFIFVPLVALGIALAFLLYTFFPGEIPPTSNSLILLLPEKLLSEGGGIFYTNYGLLRQTLSPTSNSLADVISFSQEIAPFDLGSSLFRFFWLPELSSSLGLNWLKLEEAAWSPRSSLEVVKGLFDYDLLAQELEEAGYASSEQEGAIYLDRAIVSEEELSSLGQVAIVAPFLLMEHFVPDQTSSPTRGEAIRALRGDSPTVGESEIWKAHEPFLRGAPSFYLGPAPASLSLESLLSLDPAASESNWKEKMEERGRYLLSPNFIDFCAFSSLEEAGRVTFILRYENEDSAKADAGKIEGAMRTSYSATYRGENFLSLLGEPQVQLQGNMLRIVSKSANGIKILQGLVKNGDFGFLYRWAAE